MLYLFALYLFEFIGNGRLAFDFHWLSGGGGLQKMY